MRALFFGTPAFAVPCLSALAARVEVVRVICQPDRPAGRGLEALPPPVKARAIELGIPVMQPVKVKPPELAEELASLRADVGVVVAYGRILPAGILRAPRLGCVNVHASLLPRWRGAAPIQWAVSAGDAETGVCLMEMDEGLDTGAVISRAVTPIGADETGGELAVRLSALGAELLARDLERWARGELRAEPQDEARATHARILEKRDAHLDLGERARAVHDHARAMQPWPGAVLRLRGARVKVHRTRVGDTSAGESAPGSVVATSADAITVACGGGTSLELVELQLEGKKRLGAAAFAQGARVSVGDRFDAIEGDDA